jgi:hypothetical protein
MGSPVLIYVEILSSSLFRSFNPTGVLFVSKNLEILSMEKYSSSYPSKVEIFFQSFFALVIE